MASLLLCACALLGWFSLRSTWEEQGQADCYLGSLTCHCLSGGDAQDLLSHNLTDSGLNLLCLWKLKMCVTFFHQWLKEALKNGGVHHSKLLKVTLLLVYPNLLSWIPVVGPCEGFANQVNYEKWLKVTAELCIRKVITQQRLCKTV